MMNWFEINRNYPYSFSKFLEEVYFDGFITEGRTYFRKNDVVFSIRDLYDFFDKQGIIIELGFNSRFKFALFINEKSFWNDMSYLTRTEAEDAVFTEAFRILEDKLKK